MTASAAAHPRCMVCPSLRRALCMVPCCEEIAADLARVADVIERDPRYLPPMKRTKRVWPDLVGDVDRRRWRAGVDDLR